MAFDSFQDFLAMDGHAPYVWAAWAVTLGLLLACGLHARAEHRRLRQTLARRVRREQRLSGRAGASEALQYDGVETNDA